MNKFKKGDRVRRVDGKNFTSGDAVVTVDHIVEGRRVYFAETGTWLWMDEIVPSYPNPPHKHAELIKAWADGAEIEFRAPYSKSWRKIPSPSWGTDQCYRIKPSDNNAGKIAEIETTISQLQQQVKELKDAD